MKIQVKFQVKNQLALLCVVLVVRILSVENVIAVQNTNENTDTSSICTRSNIDQIEFLKSPSNRLTFDNDGGIFNGGVCWWHTRFERAAAYLAQFKPELTAPTPAEAFNIAWKLAELRGPITVPGFKNLQEFSIVHQKEIQRALEKWQMKNGTVRGVWIRGVSGRSEMEPAVLKDHIEKIIANFESKKRPAFLVLQMPGITAHAFILLDYERIQNGIDLKVIDSNYSGRVVTYEFRDGDRAIRMRGYRDTSVPYLAFDTDFVQFEKVRQQSCLKQQDDLASAL